jgi:hypothetical protein
MNEPCMCGASDCEKCWPSHFVNGAYLDPEHYCDHCQRFGDRPAAVCEWCGMQVCEACEGEHYAVTDGCGKGKQ